MASFTSREPMDWVWGSLKPWQILHSKLAERERNGNAPLDDVWELVNETLGADTAPTNSIDSGDQEAQYRGWSQGIRFLADDGEFWRHGGVMESKVREWLSRRDEELKDQLLSHPPSAHHLHHYPHLSSGGVHHCSTDMAIARSTLPAQEYHSISCPIRSEQLMMTVGTADEMHDHEAEDREDRFVRELDNQRELTVEEEEYTGSSDEEDAEGEENQFVAELEEGYHEYNALICSNYGGNHDNGAIKEEGECELVVNRLCSSRSEAAAAACEDHDRHHVQAGEAAKLAAGLKMEEEMEVCAVCLEQLNEEDEEGEMRSVVQQQALACRHVFHRACIEPWLERQPHACCPCCRAPISPAAILARPTLNVAGPLYVAASNSPPITMACSRHHHHHDPQAAFQHDIMGLLADMEAALEHFGFRS